MLLSILKLYWKEYRVDGLIRHNGTESPARIMYEERSFYVNLPSGVIGELHRPFMGALFFLFSAVLVDNRTNLILPKEMKKRRQQH